MARFFTFHFHLKVSYLVDLIQLYTVSILAIPSSTVIPRFTASGCGGGYLVGWYLCIQDAGLLCAKKQKKLKRHNS